MTSLTRPGPAEWRAFRLQVLNGAGIASLGAGVIFFVAANWQDYGLMGRFATLQAALVATVGVSLWRPPPDRVGTSALVLAILVTGALLALFGQSYQTGADLWELFFAWALLALPFAIAARTGAVWATWWVVLNVGMALFCGLQEGSLMRFFWSGRFGFGRPLLILFACLINLGGAALFLQLRQPQWLAHMAGTFGFLFGTAACMIVIVSTPTYRGSDGAVQNLAVIAGFAAACGGVAYWTLRARSDVFPMALICASWIAITTVFLAQHLPTQDFGGFLVLSIWLIGTSTAAGVMLMRWVRAWRK
jgi:uncharacterized membrane protein